MSGAYEAVRGATNTRPTVLLIMFSHICHGQTQVGGWGVAGGVEPRVHRREPQPQFRYQHVLMHYKVKRDTK